MTLASDAAAIFRAGVRSVDPRNAVLRSFECARDRVRVGGRTLRREAGGAVWVVAIGKAAGPMLDAAIERTGPRADGLAVVPRGYPRPRSGAPVLFGEHPVPGTGSVSAGRRVLERVRGLASEDLLVVLLSGGGSATADVPAGTLELSDLRRTTEALLGSGAPIGAANAIRRHLSEFKGGQLATARGCRQYATLAISDVVGDAPEDIASGPTVPDPTSYRDAVRVVREYSLEARLPPRVLSRLTQGTRGRWPETPKPGDPRLGAAPFVLVATNRQALAAAAREARRRGFRTRVDRTPVTGETRTAAVSFARELLRPGAEARRPWARVAGGETTVTLGPRPGRGGRNQEFAVASAGEIAGWNALVLSGGTDGVDGPTDAAGGVVDGATRDRAEERGVDLSAALSSHSTYSALRRLGALFTTGPTGTNVMDLHVGLVRPRRAGRLRMEWPHGPIVRPGAEHWELVLRERGLSRPQRAWLRSSGVGLRSRRSPPRPGRPYWDELVPLER